MDTTFIYSAGRNENYCHQFCRAAGGEASMFGCNEGQVHSSGADFVINGGLIQSMIIVGDTGGPDINNGGDCRCDTKIKKITFNSVTVTVARL